MNHADRTTTDPLPFGSVDQVLETWSVTDPNKIALTAPGHSGLSFQELYSHVKAMVVMLNQVGIGRNDRVAVVMPNGLEMALAFLATAAGATSCPLNPRCRANEFDFFLSDLGARAVIVQSGDDSPVREVAADRGIPVLELELEVGGGAKLFAIQGNHERMTETAGFSGPGDTALILHTSGTTSRPKLVPLTNDNIFASVQNVCTALALQPTDCCLNIMPLFHIHGLVAALLSSLASGGRVVCAAGFNENRFFGWVSEFSPTWYTAVPTMHRQILEHARKTGLPQTRTSLRLVRSSSAAMDPGLISDYEKLLGVPLIEAYGMTEGAHQIASNPLPPNVRKAGSVGKATGTEIVILNETGQYLKSGDVGEISIRGPNVTGGYEDNPQANEESFTKGWFRTGDQGYMDDDDYVFITGRLKEIINRGGEKVAPREIDEALLGHPEIVQAVTFPVPHPSLGEDVSAAVVLRDGVSLTEESIREFLFEKLADFKIPSRVVIVDKIPEGSTGKVQRIGLFEKLKDMHQPSYVAPRDAVEAVLAAIWAEVLNVEDIGAFDNFFVLGGDSIQAIQVVSRIAGIFQVDIPLVELFRKPTVTALSKEISASMGSGEIARITSLVEQMSKLPGQEASGVMQKAVAPDLKIPRLDRSKYR